MLSFVSILPPRSGSPTIPVAWSGSDQGSSAATYELEVSEDGGAWQPLLTGTPATGFQIIDQPAYTYTYPSVSVGQPILTTGWIPGILESVNAR
ncbi:MAG: hypothetical protein H5T62_14250 [Anaerolineae bacterium]|nr:hypothetical protein [Anaerolineae bacterium]